MATERESDKMTDDEKAIALYKFLRGRGLSARPEFGLDADDETAATEIDGPAAADAAKEARHD